MQRVIDHLEMLRRFGLRLGPYLMLEILLPGGSLFALLLFLYQRRKLSLVPQPCCLQPSPALRSAVDDSE